MVKKVLSINFSDTSGISGIQNDLVIFQKQNVFGFSAITQIVTSKTEIDLTHEKYTPELLGMQLDSVLAGGKMDATKIGHLNNSDELAIVLDLIDQGLLENIVLDLHFVENNLVFLNELVEKLVPKASALILTPSILASITNTSFSSKSTPLEEKARKLLKNKLKHVLIQLENEDYLYYIVSKDSPIDNIIAKQDIAAITTARLALKN